jgi:hypothetical protein
LRNSLKKRKELYMTIGSVLNTVIANGKERRRNKEGKRMKERKLEVCYALIQYCWYNILQRYLS